MREYGIGTIELLLATLIWGYGYTVIKTSLDIIPLNVLMTSRYVIAAVALSLVFIRRLKNITKRVVAEGAVMGFLLYISQYAQTTALSFEDTTAGEVAFITALYVVIVPFINLLILRVRPGINGYIAALLAVPGLALLTGGGGGFVLRMGVIVALFGSLGFSVHILAIERFDKRDDPCLLTVMQFAWAAVFAGTVQLISGDTFPQGISIGEIARPLIYLGIFSTMFGFLMQICGQKHLPSNASATLIAMESVFGMLFSVLLLGERLAPSGIAGCILMFAAVVVSVWKKQNTDEAAS